MLFKLLRKLPPFHGIFMNSTHPLQEAKTSVIEITHEDSEAVELMINWMYYGDTHINVMDKAQQPIVSCLRLWIAADFYQVPALKTVARDFLNELLQELEDKNSESITSTGSIGSTASTEICKAIELTYSSTPETEEVGPRKIIPYHCARYYRYLSESPMFRTITVEGFWKDLSRELHSLFECKRHDLSFFSCKQCRRTIVWELSAKADPVACPHCAVHGRDQFEMNWELMESFWGS